MYFSSFPDRSIEKVMIKRRPTICTPMRIPKQLPIFWVIFSQISLVFARDSSSRLYNPKKEAISVHERTDTSKIVYRMSRTLARAPSVHLVAIAHSKTSSAYGWHRVFCEARYARIFALISFMSTQFSSAILIGPHCTST